MAKSYIGNPYFNSDRKARLWKKLKDAKETASKVNGNVHQIGRGSLKVYVVKKLKSKYYLR